MIASLYALGASWAGRASLALVAVLLLWWVWRSLLTHRSHIFLLPVFGAVTIAGVLLYASIHPHVWTRIAATSHLTRIRLLMAGISLLVLVVSCESIRRSLLRERYALLWVATGILILLCSFFPSTLDWFSRTFGMQYVTTVVAVVFTFLVLVSFHFSTALSRVEKKLGAVAQRCAMLEARLEVLEKPPSPPAKSRRS